MASDVVYILKNRYASDELRYSLRSIEKIEHGSVWFVGGRPDGLYPDCRMSFEQEGDSKWERVRNSLLKVCENADISDTFWLFNDDFFILKDLPDKPLFNGTLRDHILHVEHRHGDRPSRYTARLRECEQMLKEAGLSTFNYALHVPMLIDKAKMKDALNAFPSCPMFRSIYGNYAEIGGDSHKDVKIVGLNKGIPNDADMVSTTDESFRSGAVGADIRDRFREKSRYESKNDTV